MHFSLEKQRLAVVGLLLLWCLALLLVSKIAAGHSPTGADFIGSKSALGLAWNLSLAFLPLVWSVAFQVSSARKHKFPAGIWFLLWLLFLPNGPYILTDLVHLEPRPAIPFWYVLAMLLSYAGAGTLLGYFSLLNVQGVIEQHFGKVAGWVVAIGSLMASGFGIYLGRFLRWNSWDALTSPHTLVRDSIEQFRDPIGVPHPIPVTLVFGVGLVIGYLAIRSAAAFIPPQNHPTLSNRP